MTGHELRLLRALCWRGPIFAADLQFMIGRRQALAMADARRLVRDGYVERSGQQFRITDAGRDMVEALTP